MIKLSHSDEHPQLLQMADLAHQETRHCMHEEGTGARESRATASHEGCAGRWSRRLGLSDSTRPLPRIVTHLLSSLFAPSSFASSSPGVDSHHGSTTRHSDAHSDPATSTQSELKPPFHRLRRPCDGIPCLMDWQETVLCIRICAANPRTASADPVDVATLRRRCSPRPIVFSLRASTSRAPRPALLQR